MPMQELARQHIIQANSLHKLPIADTIFNTIKLEKAVEWAFLDFGTTLYFLCKYIGSVKHRTSPIPDQENPTKWKINHVNAHMQS